MKPRTRPRPARVGPPEAVSKAPGGEFWGQNLRIKRLPELLIIKQWLPREQVDANAKKPECKKAQAFCTKPCA